MTLLCIPLSSRLVKYTIQKISSSTLPNRAEFIQITDPVLKHRITKVTKVSYKDLKDKGLSIWVWIQVGHVPDRVILDEMEALLSKKLNRKVTVSIWPEFVMTKEVGIHRE